jgi:hypothetical protein
MTHDIAYRFSARLAGDRTITVNTDVWSLYVCGVSYADGQCLVHVAAVGPRIDEVALRIDEGPYRLTTEDLRHAVATWLELDWPARPLQIPGNWSPRFPVASAGSSIQE